MRRAFFLLHALFSACAIGASSLNAAFESFLRLQVNATHHDHSVGVFRHTPVINRNQLLVLFANLTVQKYGTDESLLGAFAQAHGLAYSEREGLIDEVAVISERLNQLPEGLALWPVIRRAVIASLALRFDSHGPFQAGPEADSVKRLLLQLFFQHRESARQRGVLEFAHVSKSGGTTFCQLARGNGCRSESFSPAKNCLITKFKDEPRYLDARVHRALGGPAKTQCKDGFKAMHPRSEISCGERRRWLQRQGFSMYANEYTALGGRTDPAKAHPCRNMLTVLELRHPHDRVISHIRHMWHGYRAHCGDDRWLYFAGAGGHNTSTWAALLPAPANNYLVRSLLGEAVFNLPPDGIARAHLDLAKELLAEQYDVVLVLEEPLLFRRGLRYGLGWGAHERHANPSRPDSEEGLPADLEALWALNALDVELYEFGVLMAGLDDVMYEVAMQAEEEAAQASLASSAEIGDSSGNISSGASGSMRRRGRRRMVVEQRTDGGAAAAGGYDEVLGMSGSDATLGIDGDASHAPAAAAASSAASWRAPDRSRWLLGWGALLAGGAEGAEPSPDESWGALGRWLFGRRQTAAEPSPSSSASGPSPPAASDQPNGLPPCGWVGAPA